MDDSEYKIPKKRIAVPAAAPAGDATTPRIAGALTSSREDEGRNDRRRSGASDGGSRSNRSSWGGERGHYNDRSRENTPFRDDDRKNSSDPFGRPFPQRFTPRNSFGSDNGGYGEGKGRDRGGSKGYTPRMPKNQIER